MPRTRIPVTKFPVDKCTWETFEPSERAAFLEKKLRAKHGLFYRCCPGEEDDWLCEDYSLYTEWEIALLKGETLWAVHAKFQNFLTWLDIHWASRHQEKDWVHQEKEAYLGVLRRVTSDKALLAHLSVGVIFDFDRHGRNISRCQLCSCTRKPLTPAVDSPGLACSS
jgi:hypothetical protein